MLCHLVLTACLALGGPFPSDQGVIEGTVVIASGDPTPAAGAEVVLRVAVDGRFVPLAETTADRQGKFRFAPLPVGPEYLYLPGANRDGVHYPGPRVRLTPAGRRADVRLEVRDAVAEPNPLVARRHEFVLRPEPGVLKVTETIVVDNPTTKCFVGRAAHDGAEPVTLQLGIPADFERVTFAKEFFGRRFSVIEGKLLTGIPWQPGRRELKFTYLLRNEQKHRLWQRALDLPCSHLRVCVDTERPDQVACNLGSQAVGHNGEVVFESRGETLPAGHLIRVELGRLPVGWMAYGRWLALAALAALVAGTRLAIIVRRHCRKRPALPADPRSTTEETARSSPQRSSRSARRKRKPKTASRRAA